VLAGLLAPISGRIVGSRGARPVLLFGGICMTIAPLLLTGLSPTTPLAMLLVAYAIYGMGFGAVNPPITYTAVSGMPNSQAGVAAAVASTSRQVGQTLGVAIIGSIVGTAAGAAGKGLAGASHPAWWVIAACGAAVLALGAASTGVRAQRAAKRAAAALATEAQPA
jgi:MFS family permease